METSELQDCKNKLDKVSPTFCLAKWKQVTVHLESGLTHSCHHPAPHKIPLDELEESIFALHNTKYKIDMRKDMLNGVEVKECEYCNRIERNAKNSFSDRVYKSAEDWAIPFFDECAYEKINDVFPSYFEVSFSSNCNCRCMYCSPTYSTTWENSIRTHGGFPTSQAQRNLNSDPPPPKYGSEEKNPYIEAFWKWWPDLYKNLKVFRITGGEPLLDKNLYKLLNYMVEHPRKDLRVDINSNLNLSEKRFDRFLKKMKLLEDKGFKLKLYTSCEAYGKRAEYIRFGLRYEDWLKNCHKFLTTLPESKLTIMSTYNILSITSFKDFLKDILNLKQTYRLRCGIDIPFLMNPSYLQANIISKDFMPYIEDAVTFMYHNLDIPRWFPLSGVSFFEHEIRKLVRIFDMVRAKPENLGCKRDRKDFKLFIDEYDRRNNSVFLDTFPEYENFYKLCEEY